MNGNRDDAAAYAFAVNAALETSPASLEFVFCPPFTLLAAARSGLPANARLVIGAQDCHSEAAGAFTGAVSAQLLKDAGCSYVIVGHSECRQRGDDEAAVAAKANAAQAAGLTPILCVGESQPEYAAGQTAAVLSRQLAHVASRPRQPAAPLLIAYEPVWAIGSGKTPKMAEISAAHAHIKTVLGSAVPVLYGGSVKSTNLGEILALEGVDGALVGGASLAKESMLALLSLAVKK